MLKPVQTPPVRPERGLLHSAVGMLGRL
jgi:hypothetical protein